MISRRSVSENQKLGAVLFADPARVAKGIPRTGGRKRIADHLSYSNAYSRSVISPGRAPIVLRNATVPGKITDYANSGNPEIVFVCGGTNVASHVDREIISLLRRMARDSAILGGSEFSSSPSASDGLNGILITKVVSGTTLKWVSALTATFAALNLTFERECAIAGSVVAATHRRPAVRMPSKHAFFGDYLCAGLP